MGQVGKELDVGQSRAQIHTIVRHHLETLPMLVSRRPIVIPTRTFVGQAERCPSLLASDEV